MKLAALLIACLIGGWLFFDGTRALIKGDYVTPKSGEHRGQLGPWSRLVSWAGIDPRSTAMKVTHVLLGLLWIISGCLFLIKQTWGVYGLVGTSVLTLWYLPFGTALAVIELLLLFRISR